MAAAAEPLHRSRDDRMLAGVAAGVAETLGADPSIVRILWALLAILTGGVAFVVYIVMVVVVPEAPYHLEARGAAPGASGVAPDPNVSGGTPDPNASGVTPDPSGAQLATTPAPWSRSAERAARRAARRARRREAVDSGSAALIFGAVLIAIGGLFLVRHYLPWFSFQIWWPIAIVALGVLLIVVAVLPNRPKA